DVDDEAAGDRTLAYAAERWQNQHVRQHRADLLEWQAGGEVCRRRAEDVAAVKSRTRMLAEDGGVCDAAELVAGWEGETHEGVYLFLGRRGCSNLSTLTQPSPNPGRGFICGFILLCVGLAGRTG